MYDFNSSNKLSGVYWLKKAIENLQIKVTLKPQDGMLSLLPRFEPYTKETEILLENCSEEFNFKWQQKVFSLSELNRFANVHNCITDTELKYHDVVENTDIKSCKVFSYIHDDYHLPLPSNSKNKLNETNCFNLGSKLEQLSLNNAIGRIFGSDDLSTRHLFKSETNVSKDEEDWTAMHVVFDNSEYTEDSQLLFKQEVTLLSLYHNVSHNFIIISPDVNNLEFNPYAVETISGEPLGYQYAVDIDFGEAECGEELALLLTKLLKKWQKKQKCMLNFVLPALERRHYYVTLEILTATGFEMDNLYIEFDIKVPEGIQCNENLHGRTYTSTALTLEDNKEWNFAHNVEFSLELAADAEAASVKVFVEVISTDWWCRHRTEGYCYLPLTLEPGRYSKQLSCRRPEEFNPVEAESRRFFVGGCHLIKDLDVLAKPQLQDANFKYATTGTVKLSWSVISQSHIPGVLPSIPQAGTSTASALLQGAEVALRKYKKARAKLAAATKDMGDVKSTGSGDRYKE